MRGGDGPRRAYREGAEERLPRDRLHARLLRRAQGMGSADGRCRGRASGISRTRGGPRADTWSINYTARGFRNANEQGSTGTTQLDSRRYEINDYQYLVGPARRSRRRTPGGRMRSHSSTSTRARSERSAVATAGDSHGSPSPTRPWKSPVEQDVDEGRGSRSAGTGGPTSSRHSSRGPLSGSGDATSKNRDRLPTTTGRGPVSPPDRCEKQSIVSGLYGSGNTRRTRTTRRSRGTSTRRSCACSGRAVRRGRADRGDRRPFFNDRSAYYHQGASGSPGRERARGAVVRGRYVDRPVVPGRSGRALLQQAEERSTRRIRVQMYLGDYQHFVANKAKEWGDLCGDDHHVCTLEDFRTAEDLINLGKAPTRQEGDQRPDQCVPRSLLEGQGEAAEDGRERDHDDVRRQRDREVSGRRTGGRVPS